MENIILENENDSNNTAIIILSDVNLDKTSMMKN